MKAAAIAARGPRPGGVPAVVPVAARRRTEVLPPQEGLQVLRREDRQHQLQGRAAAVGQFVAEAGKIVPRRLTGVCTPHQRRLADAIKQARNIALLPFASR